MNKGNKIVQSLWIGSQLGTMEHLSITSFLRQGHDFHLYTYGPVGNVPEGCVIKDANKILSQKDWNYKEFPRLALFADFFRYKLLLEKGGWWVDTDTICMRPFTFPQEYVFSSEAQRDGGIHINNGNIKAPVGSPIIQHCWEACTKMDHRIVPWGASGPALMKAAVEKFGLEHFVQAPVALCPVPWWEVQKFVDPQAVIEISKETYAIHLWNNRWKEEGLDKGNFPRGSFYSLMCQRLSAPSLVGVTAIIKTFLRDDALLECVQSLHTSYPEISIIVVGDGRINKAKTARLAAMGVDYHSFPFGSCGLNRARNYMLDLCRTPYVLVGDDDFVYAPTSNLEAMRLLLEDADIVTGAMIQDGNIGHFEGVLERRVEGFYFRTWKGAYQLSPDGTRYANVDLGYNFYMTKRAALEKLRYDENYIGGGFNHEDFFISAHEAKLRVRYSPDTTAIHRHDRRYDSPEYKIHRYSRWEENRIYFEKKWGRPLLQSPNAALQGWKQTATSLDDVTAVIKTFLRDDSLFLCVRTIREQYPYMPIIVADDGYCSKGKGERLKLMGVTKYIEMPWNRGLSAGRNALLDACETPYLLLCDDDFSFTEDSHVERLRLLMDVADIAAGLVFNVRSWSCHPGGQGWDPFGGHLVRQDGKIYRTGFRGVMKTYEGIQYEEADLVLNFFVARVDALKKVRWDDDLCLAYEHQDFFMRALDVGIRSVYTPDVQVLHKKLDDTANPEFMKVRGNYEKYEKLFLKKWGYPLEILPNSPPSPLIEVPAPMTIIRPLASATPIGSPAPRPSGDKMEIVVGGRHMWIDRPGRKKP